MVKLFKGVILFFSCLSMAYAKVGFKEINLPTDTLHPLKIAIWYPARNDSATIMIADNQAFVGSNVIKDAEPKVTANKYPLIVLSHGYGGSWRNLSWLAAELSRQGYIVAAPTHHDIDVTTAARQQSTKLWLRAQDLSKTIDAVINDEALSNIIDVNNIAAIGHSLGGWTVIALAGGRFDTKQFQQDCQTHTHLKACQLNTTLSLNSSALNKSMLDPRIKAFVTLDAGLTRGFTIDSLQKLNKPSLIIGAGVDIGDTDVKLESGYFQQFLAKPTSTYVEIADAMHFSFIQICKSGAKALLEQENKGDAILCEDGGRRERAEIHREVSFLILGFLSKVFANPDR